jgi:hypothetical protein
MNKTDKEIHENVTNEAASYLEKISSMREHIDQLLGEVRR